MWFGTSNGLNRFDGSGFKIYNRQHQNARALTNDYISCVAESKTGIWIGTASGLFLLDRKTDTIRLVVLGQYRAASIHKFEKDFDNKIWVISNKGVYIIKNETPSEIQAVYPKSKGKLYYQKFYTSAPDSFRKGIWISSSEGFCFFHQPSGEVLSYEHNPDNWNIFSAGKPLSLAIEGNGAIWFTDTVSYLRKYDFDQNRVFSLAQTGIDYPKELEDRNAIHSLNTDSRGRIWINGWQGWLQRIENDAKIISLSDFFIRMYEPAKTLYRSIYTDNWNNDWFLSNDGVYKLSGYTYFEDVTQFRSDGFEEKQKEYAAINRVVTAGTNEWWICTESGLYLYNSARKKQEKILINKTSYRANRFYHAAFFEGEWWFATGNGIQIYNPATKKFRPFTHYVKGYEVVNKSITNLVVDKKNTLWFSVWADAVYRYDPVLKTTERFDGTNPSQGDMMPYDASSLTMDKKGNLWFTSAILRKFDFDKQKWEKPYLPEHNKLFEQQQLFGIAEDKNGNKWIGVKTKGAFLLDKNGKIVDSVNTENGISSDMVYDFYIDKYDRLWMSTSEAVHFISFPGKNVSTIDFKTTYSFGDYWPVFGVCGDTLAITYNDIVCFVSLEKLGKQQKDVKPLITSIRVFEKEIPYNFSEPSLNLKYSQNFFTIDFSSPDHLEIPSIQYAYKLEGLNNDWVYCGKRQVASFSNLTNGHYRFMVKSTDANGDWNETAMAVSIVIKPPFWKTAWFFLLLLLAAGTLGYLYFNRNQKRKQKLIINKTIDYFANSVYGENSIDEICWDIARNCISQLGFEDCVVYLLNEKTNRLVQKAAFGTKNPKGHEIANPIEIEIGKGIVGTVAQTGKAEIINDTSSDNRYMTDDKPRLSELAVPVLHEGKVIGIIDSESNRGNYFTADHLKAVSTIASISANKIAEAQAQQLARENELKLLDINRMLAETKLMALRAQMNPHFVFNCLNSIQECIIRQKYADASNYLNKFSKLFRLVLNNSGKQLVSVAEEKEVLELYLQLEYLRFENKFQYKITADEKLDMDDTLMPSMLVQPFAENALWHGLLHKTENRMLNIEFKLINKNVFCCIIEDNGIGRKKAVEIKEQQGSAKKHESKGLRITTDRIQLLKKQGHHAVLSIIDMQDESGEATGTKVILELSTDITN